MSADKLNVKTIKEPLVSIMRRKLICSFPLAMLPTNLLFAKSEAPLEYAASVRLLPQAMKKKINANVFGVCLMYPPFDALGEELKKWRGRSVRVWARPDMQWWKRLLPALQEISPETLLLFVDSGWHPEQVKYVSSADNNLHPNQQVAAVVGYMKFAMTQLSAVDLASRTLYWEAWNEPQFPQNGHWEPDAMARYVNDIALAARKEGLPFRVLAPLHMDPTTAGKEWNERLCQGLDSNLAAGLVNHYYNVGWSGLDQPMDEFLRRAGDGPLLRERVRLDRSLIERYGDGRWTLHCSEWNVHPKSYRPPYYVSRDMAAALYAFSAIKVYLEEGVESAQFFLLSAKDNHFAAYTLENGVITPRPTGVAMEWLGEKLRGVRLSSQVVCPSYRRTSEYGLTDFDVPFLEVMAAKTPDGIVLIMANKDPFRTARVDLKGVSGTLGAGDLLSASGVNRDIAAQSRINLANGLHVLPASILAVTLKA